MRPLALSDRQLDIIRRAAEPLPLRDRGAFLQCVAELLSSKELATVPLREQPRWRNAATGTCLISVARRRTELPVAA
jgi:hypothetical protein